MEKISREQYQATIEAVMSLARLSRIPDLQAVLDLMDRAEAVAPFVDPTLLIRASETMGIQKHIVAATLRYQQEINAIVRELAEDFDPLEKPDSAMILLDIAV